MQTKYLHIIVSILSFEVSHTSGSYCSGLVYIFYLYCFKNRNFPYYVFKVRIALLFASGKVDNVLSYHSDLVSPFPLKH